MSLKTHVGFFLEAQTQTHFIDLKNNNGIFFGGGGGRISTDLPKLEEAEVWLREIRKGLAAKKKAGVGGKREEERGEQAG